jgi:hypothetical protein
MKQKPWKKKKKGKLVMQRKKNRWCNASTEDGGRYK